MLLDLCPGPIHCPIISTRPFLLVRPTPHHGTTDQLQDCLIVRLLSSIIPYMKVLTIRIDDELHKAFKIKCVTEGIEMNAVVTKWIEAYVKESKPKKQK
jgi:hypothetical protein